MLEYYLEKRHNQNDTHIVQAYHDTINEELENPHTSTIILHVEETKKSMPDSDVINDILEHSKHPTFEMYKM